MTTNQTIDGVPRELLESFAAYVAGSPNAIMRARAKELRALLDAPVECRCKRYGKSNPHWPCPVHTESAQEQALDEPRALLDAARCDSCDDSGDLIDLTGEWRGYCVCPIGVALKNKPATQPRGEPVAWQYRVSAGPQTGWSLWHDGKGEEFKQSYQVETRPLYAEQPAPVAVVLPESKSGDALKLRPHHSEGWNACLDEAARLTATVRIPERLSHTDGVHTYEYVTGHNAAIDKMLGKYEKEQDHGKP